jgi:hypothetical protein
MISWWWNSRSNERNSVWFIWNTRN